MYFFSKMQNPANTVIAMKRICRHLFTSSVKSSVSRERRFMDRLIRKGMGKSGRTNDFNLLYQTEPKKQLSIHTVRRMTVLNQIFMEHVTDIMSTGEVEPSLIDRNIEISHVKVTPDFKLLNIYWINNNTDPNASDLEELLKECARELRYRLTKLRVIGLVPPVQFVKCKNTYALKEVERRLAIADYGEDFVPSAYTSAENVVVTSKSDEASEKEDIFQINLPVMRHDVFGLNHEHIMSKIKIAVEKSKQTLQRRSENSESVSSSVEESKERAIPEFLTSEEQREQFSKFLAQRQKALRLKHKNSRANTNYSFYEDEGDCDSDSENECDVQDFYDEDENKY